MANLETLFIENFTKGKSLFEQGDLAKAVVYLERAYRIKPDDSKLLNLLGMAYFRMNRLEEAEQIYEVLTRKNPNIAVLHSNLGLIRLKKGDYDGAEMAFLRVLQLQPNNQKVYGYMGLIAEKREEYDLALEYYEKARATQKVKALQELLKKEEKPEEKKEEAVIQEKEKPVYDEPDIVEVKPLAGETTAATFEDTSRQEVVVEVSEEETAKEALTSEHEQQQDMEFAREAIEEERKEKAEETEIEVEEVSPVQEATPVEEETEVEEEEVKEQYEERISDTTMFMQPGRTVDVEELEIVKDEEEIHTGDTTRPLEDVIRETLAVLKPEEEQSATPDVESEPPVPGEFPEQEAVMTVEDSAISEEKEFEEPEEESEDMVEYESETTKFHSPFAQTSLEEEGEEEIPEPTPSYEVEQVFPEEEKAEVVEEPPEPVPEEAGETHPEMDRIEPETIEQPAFPAEISSDTTMIREEGVFEHEPESGELEIETESEPVEEEIETEPAEEIESIDEPAPAETEVPSWQRFIESVPETPQIVEELPVETEETKEEPPVYEESQDEMEGAHIEAPPSVEEVMQVQEAESIHVVEAPPALEPEQEQQPEPEPQPEPESETEPLVSEKPEEEAEAVEEEAFEKADVVQTPPSYEKKPPMFIHEEGEVRPVNLSLYTPEQLYIHPPTGSERFLLLEPYLLEIIQSEEVYFRNGALVAFNGELAFEKMPVGEDFELISSKGFGILFLSYNRLSVQLLTLNEEKIYLSLPSFLVAQATLDIRPRLIAQSNQRVFPYLEVQGTGTVGFLLKSKPLNLKVSRQLPAVVHSNAVVAWSGTLEVQPVESRAMKDLIRAYHEQAIPLRFEGVGDVIVERSALWGERRSG